MSDEDIVKEVVATLALEGIELCLENMECFNDGLSLALVTKGESSDE